MLFIFVMGCINLFLGMAFTWKPWHNSLLKVVLFIGGIVEIILPIVWLFKGVV